MNQMNMNQMPMVNQMNNPMQINNKMAMNNMMNQMLMNNMMNNPMPMNNMMNNMMNNPMPMNNMMNNMMNNPMPMNNMMNNMMNNPMPMNNFMNPMLMNNMMNPDPMLMNNMINNPMAMNMMNMMNMPMPIDNQMMMMNGPMPFDGGILPMNNINNKNKKDKNGFQKKKYNPNIKRKIPPILQKNANKKIESITFKVEKGLNPIGTSLCNNTQNMEQIFNRLFQKRKKGMNENGELVYLKENEPMEILHYKLDTNKTEIYNFGKKSLIQGLVIAYKNHFPITISPDMIWLLILQGYSRFMDKYSELVREKYVNFQGQKTLYINRYGIPVKSATDDDWNGILDECVEQIGEHIGEEIISNLQSDFTTTNAATLLASQASIMSAMKHYFKYEVLMGGCGISYITLEGSLDDWKKIKSKLKYLSNFALNWWTKHLIPIIDNIIKTKIYYNENKKINNELVDFWKTMIRIKGKGDLYDPHILNGWIIKFIPNLYGEHPELYKELKETEVPDQIISCPLKIVEDNSVGYKVVYNCDIASGFFGMIQDKKSLNVRPVIGYAIVVEEKETSPLTREDKEEIIKNYFS